MPKFTAAPSKASKIGVTSANSTIEAARLSDRNRRRRRRAAGPFGPAAMDLRRSLACIHWVWTVYWISETEVDPEPVPRQVEAAVVPPDIETVWATI